ncbi:MAG: sulfite exporter TauE/SafE family protein [Methanotrichaceae archaeon]
MIFELMQEPQLTYVLVLMATGVLVGMACGLLGVGGAFIMVPIQLWALTSMGIDATIATRVAFGTGLAVILPTSISGCYGHSCRGVVLWKPGVIMGLSGLAGAFIGGSIAAHAPAAVLKTIFGAAVLAGGFRMLLAERIRPGPKPKANPLYYVLWGFPVGIVSGLSGIGGGVLMVPVLVVAMGFSMLQAVGTSTVAIALNSIGGISSYAINGMGVPGRPDYSLGYIDLLQFILLAGTSVPAAQLGVRFAHFIPGRQLRYIFMALMFYIGLRMIGVFAWLGLPI